MDHSPACSTDVLGPTYTLPPAGRSLLFPPPLVSVSRVVTSNSSAYDTGCGPKIIDTRNSPFVSGFLPIFVWSSVLTILLTSANVLAVLAKAEAEADTEADTDTESKNPPYPLAGG